MEIDQKKKKKKGFTFKFSYLGLKNLLDSFENLGLHSFKISKELHDRGGNGASYILLIV